MIDRLILAGYLTSMLILGWRSRRQSAESYWVAKRRYGTGPVAVSLVATIFGASSAIGIIGLGFSRGLTGAWWSLIGAVALIPFGLILAARVRALGVYTLPDILKLAYGERVAFSAGVVIALAWCGVVAAQMVAGALLVNGVFPISFQWVITLVAVVFVLYTFWGGQISVMRTDSWQLVLFLGGLFLLTVWLGFSRSEPASFLDDVPPGHLSFPVSSAFGWYDLLVFYPIILGLPSLVGPDIYSRILCAKDHLVARKSVLVAAAAMVPVSFLLALLGVLARARFPATQPEAALPTALSYLLPAGLKGLVTVGFLAAIMSSADTVLISAATILSLNVLGPLGKMSRAQLLRFTKLAVVAVGVVAWLIAGLRQEIISSLLLAYAVFVGGVVLPTLASFAPRRLGVTPAGAMWAVLAGGAAALAGEIQEGRLVKLILTEQGNALARHLAGPRYMSLLPVALSLVVMIGVSRLTRSGR